MSVFDGVSFTPVVNNLFDVPAGKKYFIIRARLNNDPFTRVDLVPLGSQSPWREQGTCVSLRRPAPEWTRSCMGASRASDRLHRLHEEAVVDDAVRPEWHNLQLPSASLAAVVINCLELWPGRHIASSERIL